MRQVPMVIEPELDDPGCAIVMVDGTVAGRPYRFILDTGAARTQLEADEYTAALSPVTGDASFSAFGGRSADPVVTITDLAAGPLQAATLAVTRVERGGPDIRNLLGMDVLQRYCCHFRLDASVLELEAPPGYRADQNLLMSSRGHVYVDVQWPGVTGHACWDTGSGATVVNLEFWQEHPELFEEIGTSVGTDGSGAQADTPVLMMTGPVIGQRTFTAHRAVAVDLSGVNSTLEYPMDLILGYPTLRQADWLFDFPAKRWTLTN
jgi:predicted aspartyl protease